MTIMKMVGVHLQGSRLRRRSLGTDFSEAEMGKVFTVQINLSPKCSKSSPFSTKIIFTISSHLHYLVNRNAPAYVSVLARVPILQELVFRKQIICCICIIFSSICICICSPACTCSPCTEAHWCASGGSKDIGRSFPQS